MARKHIQDDDRGYSFALHYVKFATRLCYRSFRVHGWDKVPTDGSVIFVSNHTGSLMDPLVQLTAEGHKVVFMARADVFHKPKVAKILRWLRILPVYRIRDGYAAVKSNDKIIDEAVGVLTDRCPLALYPEGTHRTKHSLLRLSKGVFHIALEAERRIAGQWPVYIVPMGIEYGDYFRFRTSLEIQIGDPICVGKFVNEFDEANPGLEGDHREAVLINAFRERLTTALQPLFSWLPDDDRYEASWEWVKLRTAQYHPLTPYERKTLNHKIIESLLKFRDASPTAADALLDRTAAFKAEREQARVSIFSTSRNATVKAAIHAIAWSILLIIGLPVFLLSAILTLPVWIIGGKLARGAKDHAWNNTWRFAVNFVYSPLLSLALFIAFLVVELPGHAWWSTLLIALLIAYAAYSLTPIFYGYLERLRLTVSDWRWLFRPVLRKKLSKLISDISPTKGI